MQHRVHDISSALAVRMELAEQSGLVADDTGGGVGEDGLESTALCDVDPCKEM